MTVYEGMKGIPENGFINVKNRSFVVAADIEIPKGGAEGVVIAQGGEMGGWSLYVKNGGPRFAYNFLGREISKIVGPDRLPSGKMILRFEFAYDGGRPGAGGNGSLFVNDQKVATGRIEPPIQTPLGRKPRTWARTSIRLSATTTRWAITSSPARFARSPSRSANPISARRDG